MGHILIALCLMFTLVHGATIHCRDGWRHFGGSCFRFIGSDVYSWQDAQTFCGALDPHGKLVEIGSKEENDFIVSLLKENAASFSWLGLQDRQKEGNFVWANTGLPPSYQNWAPGKPNNLGNEDCVVMKLDRGHGLWDDQDCSATQHFFVCEVVGDMSSHLLPFRDVSLPWKARVEDLVGRLTLREITLQLANGGAPLPAPHISRLGIEDYQWWSNCGRGYVGAPGNATAFPQSIGIAATFDRQLRFRMAEATGNEARAKHSYYLKHGRHGMHTGLSCFSPDLDLLKHPFWGRNQETQGEDPYIARVHADHFIRGLQGNHPRYARATAGCKHFAIRAGPDSKHSPDAQPRFAFDAKVSMEDMRMTYLPGFRQCVESGSYSFMTSYNAINGVPVAANHWLLTELTRDEWNFTGYLLADAGAVENVRNFYHYAHNPVDTVAACINAGLNIEVSYNNPSPDYLHIEDAIQQGKLTEAKVREMVKPLFYTRLRLGEFDPPSMNPYTKLDLSVVESAAHQQLAVEAAMKSFVLLKNTGVLPLAHSHYSKVANVGPFSDETTQLYGDYSPRTSAAYKTNVMSALQAIASSVQHGKGCDNTNCTHYNQQQVLSQLDGVQLIFVALGTGQFVEHENQDKFNYNLPGHQKQLLLDVLDHAGGKPVIVLLFTGSALDISFAEADPRVSAILECFLPAQATGTALRHVLINDVAGAVPAGRLPFTWYKSESDLGDITDYSMKGKTYRYLDASTVPLYPFGFGLSYSSFHYSGLTVASSVQAGHDLTGSVTVRNIGPYDADEAVQVYLQWEKAGAPAPKLQLAWFDRVHVPKGSTVTVHFTVEAKTMALWIHNQWEIPAGPMKLYVGGQQPNQHKKVPSNVLNALFTIQGTHHPGSLIG